jgi:4-hydroxy-2-oxoheptanedioate aldolase
LFTNAMRRKLDAGKAVFGTFFKFESPNLIELIGRAGFDFVIVDAEHASFTHAGIENMVRAAELVGMSTMVRTPDAGETHILHALDSGASGVQVPALRTAEDVRQVIRRAKYYPVGERGWARACRAADYGFPTAAGYVDYANRYSTICVHVENGDMVEAIDEICAIQHLDVLFVGAGDLSQSLGHPGETDHPDVLAAVDRTIEAALAHGKHVGAVASSAKELERFVARGLRYIAWQSDMTMYKNALKAAVSEFAPYRE